MLALDVAFLFGEPTRGRIPYAGGVERFESAVVFIGVKLSPTLVEDRVIDDRGVVVEKTDGHFAVGFECGAADVARLVADALSQTDRGQSCVNKETVFTAVDHILKDDHTVFVAVIVEPLRLNFDVFTQHVESQFLHSENITLIFLRFSRQE